MKVKMLSEQEVFREAMEILLKNLSTAKMARLLATWHQESSDYLTIREQLFKGETVETLYSQIQDFQSK
ncbi:MAG: hypothetical protein ABFS56_01915 [Pseudomonadota bacterium]